MLNEFLWPADCHGGRRLKKKKSVRAHKLLVVFARLAYTSPGKNHDELIDPTVRVSVSFDFKTGFMAVIR